MPRKEVRREKKERDQGTSRAIDPLRGRRAKWKTEGNKKKETRAIPKPATLNYSVASYDAHGTYGEPILFTLSPGPQGENYIYILYLIP